MRMLENRNGSTHNWQQNANGNVDGGGGADGGGGNNHDDDYLGGSASIDIPLAESNLSSMSGSRAEYEDGIDDGTEEGRIRK